MNFWFSRNPSQQPRPTSHQLGYAVISTGIIWLVAKGAMWLLTWINTEGFAGLFVLTAYVIPFYIILLGVFLWLLLRALRRKEHYFAFTFFVLNLLVVIYYLFIGLITGPEIEVIPSTEPTNQTSHTAG